MTAPAGTYVDYIIPLGLYDLIGQVAASTQGDPNTPQVSQPVSQRVWYSQPRPGNDLHVEVITVNFQIPLSVSEIGWNALRVSCHYECWYQDTQNNWQQMMDDSYNPITLDLSTATAASWYTAHFYAYQIVAKAIQFRISRTYDPLVGTLPYCVGMQNGLIRRNIYARSDGTQGIEPQQDPIGNTITAYIQDWDASQAIDNNTSTFWRSAALPDPSAVCNLYLDIRTASGAPQLIDTLYIDPVYSGPQLNLYYSNDDTQGTTILSPISVVPVTDENTSWTQGTGLSDASAVGQSSDYQFPFAWGPLVSTDAWIGIEWQPNFSPVVSDAVQTITVSGLPTGGTFTLTYNDVTSNDIAFNTSATDLQFALTQMSSIGTGNAVVSGPIGGPWTVEFQGLWGNQAISTMTATPALTGGTDPTVAVATTTAGGQGGPPAENAILLEVTPLASAGANATQTISFVGDPDGGTFTLSFGGQTTTPLAYNCTAEDVQAALQALSTIGTNNALVVGVSGDDDSSPWSVEFYEALSNSPQPNITADASNLTGSTSVTDISIVTTTVGQVEITTEVTGQYTPQVYYNVGGGEIILELSDGTTYLPYVCSLSPLFTQGQTLRIVAGWTYENTPMVYMAVCLQNGTMLGTSSVTTPPPPVQMSFDGLVGFSDFAGLFTAHVIKTESYLTSSAAFLANAQVYVNPAPVQPDASGNIPSTTLDNAIYAAAWTTQEYGTGGGHASKYTSKSWTPILGNYVAQKGNIAFPNQINAKYLCLEFTNLVEEPYPIYDAGIQVSYQTFPVSVTSTTTQSNPGSLQTAAGLLTLGADVLLTGIGSVNWLNPQTVNNAVNSIFGAVTSPATVTTGSGSVTTLPNTTSLDIASQTRTEVSSSWVYNRNPQSATTLAQNLIQTTVGATTGQTLTNAATAIGQVIANNTSPVTNFVNSMAHLPVQGADWWVFPGATLRMSANVMNGLTAVTQTVLGRPSTVTQNSFTTTSVHQYDIRTVTRDAAVAYFAGIAEVQPYVTTYIGGTDPVSFAFGIYDSSEWTFTNIATTTNGPVTTAGALYGVTNGGFDDTLTGWTEAQGSWGWTDALGHWTDGAAQVIADGTEKSLLSTAIDVTPGTNLEASVWVTWTGLTAPSGSEAIQLQAQYFNSGTYVTSQTVGLTSGTLDTQTITITGTPTGGTFTLTYSGQTTTPIAYNADPSDVQTAFQALSNIGADGAIVSGTSGVSYTITFIGELADGPQAIITASGADLTGGTDPAGVTVSWPSTTPSLAGNTWAQISSSVALGNEFSVPDGVDTMELALVVTPDATAGIVTFDSVELGTTDQVMGVAFKDFTTYSTFAKLDCTFTDSGLVRSDDMWTQEDPNDTNISSTSLAYYTTTIPDQLPGGMWADAIATWADPTITWGSAQALVAISVDPNRIYDNKRVLHFTRAAGAGEAGISVVQQTNFVANGLFRLGCVFYKPTANDNQVTIQLRRVSDGVYIYQETFDPVVGYWYNYVTQFVEIPDSDDQEYTVEFVCTGDSADEMYLNDLYSEIALIRYLVRLGDESQYLHDVTALAYGAQTAIVSTTVPVQEFTIQVNILSPDAYAYACEFTPIYLQ